MDITSIGNVLFIVKPLMNYFISSEQDSSSNNFLHKIKLVNFISKTTKYNFNSKLIKRFRILNLYYELIQDNKNNHQITFKRRTKILKLIFKISPLDFFPRAFFQIIK